MSNTVTATMILPLLGALTMAGVILCLSINYK